MDENRAAEFTGRVLADTAAASTIIMAALGDRLGLFKDLAARGPATSGELSSRTGLSERTPWCCACSCVMNPITSASSTARAPSKAAIPA